MINVQCPIVKSATPFLFIVIFTPISFKNILSFHSAKPIMTRFLNVAKIILPLVTLISLSGCFQYPEGPVFTLQTRDERINGAWRLTSITNPAGLDISGDTSFTNITLTTVVSRSGDKSWAIFQNGNLLSLGTFLFAEHGDQIVVVYTLLFNAQTYTQEFYDIRKLTDKYFYYVDQNGYTLHYQKY